MVVYTLLFMRVAMLKSKKGYVSSSWRETLLCKLVSGLIISVQIVHVMQKSVASA